MVCFALNAHEIPLPDGVAAPLRRLEGAEHEPSAQPSRRSVDAAE